MKINLKNIALLAVAAFAIVGCSKSDEALFENKLYISLEHPIYEEDMLFQATKPNDSREISVAIAMPEKANVKAKVVAQENLAKYKATYIDHAKNVVILPQENYIISNADLLIPSGGVESTKAMIEFNNLNALDANYVYVLPISVANVVGITALASASDFYYVLNPAALINTVPDMFERWAYPSWTENSDHVKDLTTFTLEGLFNLRSTANSISTVMGIEGVFLLRFGDRNDKNQLELATNDGNFTSPNLRIEFEKWTHIAFVFDNGNAKFYFDGVLKYDVNTNTESVSFNIPASDESGGKPRAFWVGYSYASGRTFNGEMSELRVWDKALSVEDINAPYHFYTVPPSSADKLLAYWKLNEGQGGVAKDYSAYGSDLTFVRIPGFGTPGEPVWNPVALPKY